MALSEFCRKTFAGQKTRAHEAGQAVLEYILVLLLIVAIFVGSLYQFNDAFKTFLNSYFGNYIACLLETGELPSLGGEGPTSGECTPPELNLAIESSGGGDGSGGGGDSSGNADSSSSSSGDSSSGGGGSGRTASPSQLTSSGSPLNGESSSGSGNSLRPQSISKNAGSLGGDSTFGKADNAGAASTTRRGRVIRRTKTIYLGDEYLSDDSKKKKEREVVGKGKTKKGSGDSQSLRQPSLKVSPPKPQIAREDTGMNFGAQNFIKLVLILGIFIALFVFFGGMAAQIKKGWQKEE